MATESELIIITKAYDLVKWGCETTSKFPRNYRFVLGERIDRNLLDILEALIEAKYSKERLVILTRTNLRLEILRHQIRLGKDLHCMKVNTYLFAAKAIDELGRMVGGWMKVPKGVP